MPKPILPRGYKANAMACGIKKSGKLDLGLIFSQKPAKAAGVFTTNKIISGSVKLSRLNLKRSRYFHAILVNSGNANCFTKGDSFRDAQDVTKELSGILGIKKQEVLFASTGIIGRRLPVKQIKKAIPALAAGLDEPGLAKVAQAIVTTDTFVKISAAVIHIGKKAVTIYALAKGAGMIAPNMAFPTATMLCFILSDVSITQEALGAALKNAVGKSFNCITVDGCMSTNDTVFLISNSCTDNPVIHNGSKDFNKFSSALTGVCLNLAQMIVKDAEGATKFIQVKVEGAKSAQEAKLVALSIANNNLFKTAMFGNSRNFGRIAAAIGASGVDVKEENLKIKVSPLNKKNIYVVAQLNRGNSEAIVYTSDLTSEYVKINANYS
ncbi:MAG: bifunctional glutamate N-acetyltransferase/amino-acid acetyltransferase ArgJ [Candidatus Omnitrophota bacterium]